MNRILDRTWRVSRAVGVALLLCCSASPLPALATSAPGPVAASEWPATSALADTVLGTPPELRLSVPGKVPFKVRRLRLAGARPTPPVFWYEDEFEYSVALRDGPAPWVFLVAGTGSSWDAGKMRFLQAALWDAGYHVASLSSTTHPNFMVTASTSGTPGLLLEDAADLRRAMQAIYSTWRKDAPATGFAVVGYSLGATQAAAVASLEPGEGAFDFQAVVMLSPAVDLYASAGRLDALLARRFPGGEEDVMRFLDRISQAIGEIYQQLPGTEVFSDDSLFSAVARTDRPSRKTLEGLVAIAFRVAGMDMAFTADVLRGGGAIVPAGARLGRFESLTRYLRPTSRFTFEDYARGILLPGVQKRAPEVTLDQLARASSLYPLEDRLRGDERVLVVTNEDDFILSDSELEWLRGVFGARALVFRGGGHLGGLERRERIEPVLEHLKARLP